MNPLPIPAKKSKAFSKAIEDIDRYLDAVELQGHRPTCIWISTAAAKTLKAEGKQYVYRGFRLEVHRG
jgi:hypothetical protein